MSYREENGQVVLTMSVEDYQRVLMIFGAASMTRLTELIPLGDILNLLNRLNEGNPNYRPYEVAEKS
jgi:hypothetical protein